MEYIPYQKTTWTDEIVDPITGEVIEKGTLYTAFRANNFEEGIWHLSLWVALFKDHLSRIEAEMEMIGRAPINKGSFLDVLEEGTERGMAVQNERGISQYALSQGDTDIQLGATPFRKGIFVTIYDDVNTEDVKITAVNGTAIEVTPLTKNYKKGARLARSSAVAKDKKLTYGSYGTFTVTVTEVV